MCSNGIDLENLFDRIERAAEVMQAHIADLRARAAALPIGSLEKLELLAEALGWCSALRTMNKTCFVADQDGAVAPLPQFPRDWPIVDTEANDSPDADWRDAQRVGNE